MVRTIVEERNRPLMEISIYSKLIQDRIIFINTEIDDDLANGIIGQLLYLDSVSHEEITIMINSPGGSLYQGFAIIDMMNKIHSPIKTYALGVCASMAAVILLCGNHRQASKNATIMLHQPSGGTFGKITDIDIAVEEMARQKTKLYDIITSKSKVTADQIKDDFWLSSEKALELGVIDEIN